MPSPPQPAVVLLSGGLDSATTLAVSVEQGFAPFALSFRYGQRHSSELAAAASVAQRIGVREHRILDIDMRQFGGSALTADLDVPKHQVAEDPEQSEEIEVGTEIPITYVPARNTIFLSYALAWAEVLGAADIFIGVNALDYSGYPDCRPEYIAAFETLANLATKAAVEGHRCRIHAPLLHDTKAQIIRKGLALGVDYGATISCYDADESGAACGQCDSCVLRRRGFRDANAADPTRYRDRCD